MLSAITMRLDRRKDETGQLSIPECPMSIDCTGHRQSALKGVCSTFAISRKVLALSNRWLTSTIKPKLISEIPVSGLAISVSVLRTGSGSLLMVVHVVVTAAVGRKVAAHFDF